MENPVTVFIKNEPVEKASVNKETGEGGVLSRILKDRHRPAQDDSDIIEAQTDQMLYDYHNLPWKEKVRKYGYCDLPDCYCDGSRHP